MNTYKFEILDPNNTGIKVLFDEIAVVTHYGSTKQRILHLPNVGKPYTTFHEAPMPSNPPEGGGPSLPGQPAPNS